MSDPQGAQSETYLDEAERFRRAHPPGGSWPRERTVSRLVQTYLSEHPEVVSVETVVDALEPYFAPEHRHLIAPEARFWLEPHRAQGRAQAMPDFITEETAELVEAPAADLEETGGILDEATEYREAVLVGAPDLQPEAESDALPEREDPLGWMMHMAHRGMVVDEERARSGTCTDLIDPTGARVATYKDGVMGFLDPSQQELFCLQREQVAVPEPTARSIRTFVEAADACASTDGAPEFIHCMSRELANRGK